MQNIPNIQLYFCAVNTDFSTSYLSTTDGFLDLV